MSDPSLFDNLVEQFDSVWRGEHCLRCGRRQYCSDCLLGGTLKYEDIKLKEQGQPAATQIWRSVLQLQADSFGAPISDTGRSLFRDLQSVVCGV